MNIENLQELWKSLTSPKIAAVICIISGFLLFTNPKFLEYMQLAQMRAEYLSTVSIIFITGCAFLVVELVTHAWKWGNKRITEKMLLKNMHKVLQSLSAEEKVVLLSYLANNSKTQNFPFGNGVIGGLEAQRILFRSSTVGSLDSFPYNMQPWAWEHLHENLHLLGITKEALEQAKIEIAKKR